MTPSSKGEQRPGGGESSRAGAAGEHRGVVDVGDREVDGKRVPVSGFEDMCISLRVILGDHGLDNRGHFLRVFEKVKDIFDDAPDSGSGRTTVFLFPSEVEEEMKQQKRGQPIPAQRKAPEASPGPLAGMEELEEPP